MNTRDRIDFTVKQQQSAFKIRQFVPIDGYHQYGNRDCIRSDFHLPLATEPLHSRADSHSHEGVGNSQHWAFESGSDHSEQMGRNQRHCVGEFGRDYFGVFPLSASLECRSDLRDSKHGFLRHHGISGIFERHGRSFIRERSVHV